MAHAGGTRADLFTGNQFEIVKSVGAATLAESGQSTPVNGTPKRNRDQV